MRYIDLDGRIEFDIGLRADAGGGAAVGVEAGIAIAYSFKDGFSFGFYSKEYVGAEYGASAFLGPSISFDFKSDKIDTGNSDSFILGCSVDIPNSVNVGVDVGIDLNTFKFTGSGTIKFGIGVSLLPIEGHTSYVATQKVNILDYIKNTDIFKNLSKSIKENSFYSIMSEFDDYMEEHVFYWKFKKHPIRTIGEFFKGLINEFD